MRPGSAAAALVVAALALAPAAAGAASAAPPSPPCAPATPNASALLDGAVTVSPAPGSLDASYRTQISFLGVPASSIGAVSVSGSLSGPHEGTLEPYSQGDGASFVPVAPFAQGEQVTVRALAALPGGPQRLEWTFTTAVLDVISHNLETPPPPAPPPRASEEQHFFSRPDLLPPVVTVDRDDGASAPGELLLAPYAGRGQYGPMVLDRSGRLVWFDPLPAHARAADLRVQTLAGRPVLTWWQDPIAADGFHGAGLVVADSSYRDLLVLRAGNGYQPDLHAFELTPEGAARFTVYDAIRCNLAAIGGPAEGAVADSLFQELDVRTGLVRFEWHALDHVPLSASHMPVAGTGPRSPFDYFHINALSPLAGTVLVDSRNTWAAYEVQRSSGRVLWTLGGRYSSFRMGRGAAFAWQHDARQQSDGTVTLFDNGASPAVHRQSRGIVLSLDLGAHVARLLASFVHPTPLVAASQGDMEPLAGGHRLVGWGAEPYVSEFDGAGQLLFDASLPSGYESLTVFKQRWSATPAEAPRLALLLTRAGPRAYMSWNGATALAGWRLLAGTSRTRLTPVAGARSRGFETMLGLPAGARYALAVALDAHGHELARTPLARIPSRR